jgi:DMSO/TMAO reductase YedYZ molybdopterin-dependent catalytic subunit
MGNFLKRLLACSVLCLVATAAFADTGELRGLTVTLPDGSTVSLTDELRRKVPVEHIKATAHDKTNEFSGYDLRAVLAAAGLEPVEGLRGKAMRRVLVAEGSDGYAAAFALAELDPSIGNRKVLLVDTMDGKPLPPEIGPWRLVVPADARPSRWVRMLRSLAVRDAP